MASPFEKISDATDGEVTQFKNCLALAGCGRELLCAVNSSEKNELAKVMVEAAQRHLNRNPYEMTIDEQIASLRRANDEEGWSLTEEVFAQLAASAPEWPKGRHSYRSLRIRFGEESEGVALTFERHVARIKRVFTEECFWRWEHLHSGSVSYENKLVERLRLSAGNDTHFSGVEWVIVDCDANHKRKSVEAVQGPDSLADELLVLAWMFPNMIRTIPCKFLGLLAAGYEVNVPEHRVGSWRKVVLIDFSHDNYQVGVRALDRGGVYPRYFVPVRREIKRY